MRKCRTVRRLCALTLFFSLFITSSLAQKEDVMCVVSGQITDAVNKKPIERAVVKLFEHGDRFVSYAVSDASGVYLIRYSSQAEAKDLEIEASHISYISERRACSSATQNFSLKLRVKELDGVVVSAPDLKLRGDTLRYRASGFKKEGDLTAEDLLKRIPGVDVAESGTISYQGRTIDDFYIEGLDMMGSAYSIATRGLEADMVREVEIIENHQRIAQKKGKEVSDKVALNIKLTDKAKLKPKFAANTNLGYADDMAYGGGITGMLFGSRLQTMTTLKTTSLGEEIADDVSAESFDAKPINAPTKRFAEGSNSQQPSIPKERYTQGTDYLVSANAMSKIAPNASLRLNAYYSRDKDEYALTNQERYYDPGGGIGFVEDRKHRAEAQKVGLSMSYRLNDQKIYLSNQFNTQGTFVDKTFGLHTLQGSVQESLHHRDFSVQNSLQLTKVGKVNTFEAEAFIGYVRSPQNKLLAIQTDSLPFGQRLGGSSLKANISAVWRHDITPNNRLSLRSYCGFECDKLDSRNDTIPRRTNDLSTQTFSATLSPGYSYSNYSRGLEFAISAPLGIHSLSVKDPSMPREEEPFRKPLVGLHADLVYVLTPRMRIAAAASRLQEFGSINDFVSSPIRIDYLRSYRGNLLLRENTSSVASVRLEYKNPLKFFFSNIEAVVAQTKQNTTASTNVRASNVETSYASGTSHTNCWSINGHVNYFLKSIASKFIASIGYTERRSSVLYQDQELRISYHTLNMEAKILSRPIKWLEASLSGNYFINRGCIGQQSLPTNDYSQTLQIAFFPYDKFSITAGIRWRQQYTITREWLNDSGWSLSLKHTFKKWIGSLGMVYTTPKIFRITDFANAGTVYSQYKLKGFLINAGIQYRF